jgi:2-(1,2-epoxy-1,2-dihydrophenyl)acetyl-CoA isomerase
VSEFPQRDRREVPPEAAGISAVARANELAECKLAVERDGDVLHAVLDDPGAGNVIGHPMVTGLMSALEDIAAADPPVRCLLLTAAGPNFSLGGDIRYFESAGEETPDDVGHKIGALAQGLHVVLRRLRDVPVPVVTAVQGWAAGAGIGLAFSGDVVLLGESTTMRPGYIGLGFSPDGGVSWRLARALGPARATDLLMRNGTLTAAEALAAGLASRVVPDGELLSEAKAVAAKLAAGPTRALIRTRDLVRAADAASLDDQLDAEAASIAACAGEPDGLEGVAAFLAKRRPAFTGRAAE